MCKACGHAWRVQLICKIEKLEIRAVIKYFCKKGMPPKKIHEDFMDTLGKETPSYTCSTVNRGTVEFFFCGSFMFLFCLVFAMSLCASVYMCFVVTCWERADLLALVCGVYYEFVTFPLVSRVRCGT